MKNPKSAKRKDKAATPRRGSGSVFLEPISPKRKKEFLALALASRGFHRKWSAPPSTPAQFSKYMRRIGDETYRCFYICRRLDGKLVGVINISQIFMRALRSAYLGYYVFEPFAREGYMTDGLSLALREAFRKLKLHRVESNIQPGNRPSKKLVRKLGFRLEGYSPRYLKVDGAWRDHERWALTVEDWKDAS
jgi:ribosomal-protein-alanine N-acetyltransferase